MPLDPIEQDAASKIGFTTDLCTLIEKTARRPITVLRVENVPIGVWFDVANGEAAERVINALQPELLSRGCRAFWTGRHESTGMKLSDAVAVLHTIDSFEIVRVMRSDGANYGVSADDVMARLRAWQSSCKFDVVGADDDWVALKFTTLPDNICAFAEEIYDFCPDTVGQGVGLMRESDRPEFFAEARQLCPAISPKVHKQFAPDPAVFAAHPQLKAMFDMMGGDAALREETEMGIRLLALTVRTDKYLFLWWD
jgi:hypothetical protein